MMRWGCGLVVVLFLLFFIAIIGPVYLIQIPFYLVVGWLAFLQRTLPQVRVDPVGCATAAILLALLLIGTQMFGNWLVRWPAAPGKDGATTEPTPRRWPLRRTLAGLGAVILLFVSGMAAAGVGHQFGWLFGSGEKWASNSSSMQYARRAQSMNSLKMIGIAVRNYETEYGTTPAGGTFDNFGGGLHGWPAHLLPDLEQQPLYNQINFALAWDHPANREQFQQPVADLLNPQITARMSPEGYGLNHYAANSRLMNAGRPRALVSIADGLGETILAGEIREALPPWGSPTNWRDPAGGLDGGPRSFGGPYPGGTMLLFADGSVRFVKNTIDPVVLRALSTPDGGEPAVDLYSLDP